MCMLFCCLKPLMKNEKDRSIASAYETTFDRQMACRNLADHHISYPVKKGILICLLSYLQSNIVKLELINGKE